MSNPAAVLAVDDNATIRKAISMRLEAKGFRVVTAANGREALERLSSEPFDLVLLDLKMPIMSGDEVLRRVRRRYSATELPVIMLAASADKADINLTLDLGANDYIIKPGDLPILVARIRTQLALKTTVAKLRENHHGLRSAHVGEPTARGARPAYAIETETLLAEIDVAHAIPFDILHDNTPMTCFALNGEGIILHTNRFGARFLGYAPSDLVDRPMLDLYVADDRYLAHENLASAVATPGRAYRWDIRHHKNNGEVIWMRNTALAVRHNNTVMTLVTCEDIDDTYKLSEMLSFQSLHDELTGLANRKALEQRLDQVIDSAQREQTEHVLAMVDLDQFMLINDTCGYEAGDELLRQVGRMLKAHVRTRDTVARIGGDQFAVLLEDCSIGRAQEVAASMCRAIEAHEFVWREQRHSITASFGIVPIDDTCEHTGAVLSMADTACYAAKDSTSRRVHVYQGDSAPTRVRRGEMRRVSSIKDALAQDRFVLDFQPIRPLHLPPGDEHYELLLRMVDEMGDVMMPGDFLPAAERYKLSAAIDLWVVAHAFEWMRGCDPHAMVRCSINLSGQSIGNEEVLGTILEQLDGGTLAPERVCFEITETAAIADLVQATRFMQELRERGCRFALDDFGSGFSSLAYLKQLPVDYLKIDGAFVRDIANDSIDLAMVRAINEIGHVMGKQTVAEFVEDETTLEILRSVGVDFVQGYVIARPAPLDRFDERD